MGISVRVESERGEARTESVHDPGNLLHRLLPPFTDTSYQCLRFIDWYGSTVFNCLQMDTLIAELQRVRLNAHEPNERALIDAIETLAEECRRKPHRYRKFYGD